MRPNQSDCRISNLDQSECVILYHVTAWPRVFFWGSNTVRDWDRVGCQGCTVMNDVTGNDDRLQKSGQNSFYWTFNLRDPLTIQHFACPGHLLVRSRRDTRGTCRDRRRTC